MEMDLMAAKKTLFLVEDHQLFREGLKAMLSGNPGYEVIGESADGHEALRSIKKIKPDLVLLDLTMPRIDGYSVLREIRRTFDGAVKVLVLSIHDGDHYVLQAFDQGRTAIASRIRALKNSAWPCAAY
jgi:DNA-binding NarL/FixJ family response regulator